MENFPCQEVFHGNPWKISMLRSKKYYFHGNTWKVFKTWKKIHDIPWKKKIISHGNGLKHFKTWKHMETIMEIDFEILRHGNYHGKLNFDKKWHGKSWNLTLSTTSAFDDVIYDIISFFFSRRRQPFCVEMITII